MNIGTDAAMSATAVPRRRADGGATGSWAGAGNVAVTILSLLALTDY
jgi:hypothetical protein